MGILGKRGFVLGAHELKCAFCGQPEIFHPSYPAEELELDVSAGARFGTRRKPKHFTMGSLELSKKSCLWLLPSLSVSRVAVEICGSGGPFIAGIWPKGSETATSVPWGTAADKNGVYKSVWHIMYF